MTRPGFLGDKKKSAKTSSVTARKLLGGGPGTGAKSATQFADELGAALDLSAEDAVALLPDIADAAPSVVDGVSKKEGPEVTDATRAMAAALDLLAARGGARRPRPSARTRRTSSSPPGPRSWRCSPSRERTSSGRRADREGEGDDGGGDALDADEGRAFDALSRRR